jgi:hypothetical protein
MNARVGVLVWEIAKMTAISTKKTSILSSTLVGSFLLCINSLLAAPPTGEIHGVIYAEVPDATNKTNPVIGINLPDIRVYAENVATNESEPTVKTDIDGAYVLPPPPQGTYRLCWAAQGFIRGCRYDTFTPSDLTTYIRPTQITPQQNLVFGKVTFKDNTPCRFVAPTFGVNLNATVSVASTAGFSRHVNTNSAGYYVFGGLPNDQLELTAKCEKAIATRSTGPNLAVGVFIQSRNDLVLPNQALSTAAFATQPGSTIRTSASIGATINIESETLGAHPYPLHYLWQEDTPQPGFTSPNAPALAWKVPDVPRATMHVLAGDGYGAYSYKAVSLSTDTKQIMFEGRVIDENANGIGGAAVTVNGVAGVSATNGQFSVVLPEETPQYILNIDKIGFKFCSRTLNAPATGVSYQLFPAFEVLETQMPTFDAGKPFTISETRDPKFVRLANDKAEGPGAQIEFESASIVEKVGESEKIVTGPIKSYIGTYAMHDSNDQLPGDLTAITKAGQPVRLSSYGAVSVSLRDMGGKPLNIAKGKSALIRLPIDGNLLGGSPPTIKLWSFDENKGVWIEEGVATKSGNAYIGKVTHFSAVNMDLDSTTGACTRIKVDTTVFPDFLLHITSPTLNLPNGHQDQLVSDPSGLSVVGREPQNTQFTFEMYNVNGTGPLYPNGASKRTIMTGPTTTLGNKYPIQPSDYPYTDCSSEVDYDAAFLEVINTAVHGPLGSGTPFLTRGTPNVYLPTDNASTATANATTAAYYAKLDPSHHYTAGLTTDFSNWKTANNFTGPQPNDGTARAAYLNFYDLGFGRDMHMKDNSATCPGCVAFYVTNYKDQASAASETSPLATVAMEYTPPGGLTGAGAPFTKFFVFGANGAILNSVALDHNAPKFVPALCVVCHNGSFSGGPTGDSTGNLQKARFIPFDVESFYPPGTPPDPYPDEAQFKLMNNAVKNTNTSAAVADLINNVWYNNPASPTPHTNFFPAGVPSLWQNAQTAGDPITSQALYAGVVKLYCRGCHSMRDSALAFDTFAHFDSIGPRFAACAGGGQDYMPQSELNFRRFWLHSSLSQGPNVMDQSEVDSGPQTCQ